MTSCSHNTADSNQVYPTSDRTAETYAGSAGHCSIITTVLHTHPFNGPFSGTTRVSRYQKGKTNLDFTEARDSEWQWHQLGYMQVCTSLQTVNHASTSPPSFLQTGCPSCRPTNSVKSLLEKLMGQTDRRTGRHWTAASRFRL